MKMKLHFLRICSLILSCMMVCNLCNATAFAEETSDSISVEASQVQSFLPDNDSSFQDGPDEYPRKRIYNLPLWKTPFLKAQRIPTTLRK